MPLWVCRMFPHNSRPVIRNNTLAFIRNVCYTILNKQVEVICMTIKEAAAVWQITERRVNELCKTGRIAGATKKGKCWFIPDDAQKPIDKRTRIGQTAPSSPGLLGKKPLPIGVSDYRDACVNYWRRWRARSASSSCWTSGPKFLCLPDLADSAKR